MTPEHARSSIRGTFVLICLLAWPLVSSAATYTVPGNFPTIQAAINGVPTGSAIDVAPGTYSEALVVTTGAKSFTVRGVGGPAATIIDAVGKNAPALTVYGTTGSVVFSGITFRRGAPPSAAGGGFVITNASPSFFNCIFESNTASGGAGGALLTNANATFTGCIIRNNTARGSGGGVEILSGSRPVFTSTDIINNISGTTVAAGVGGGVDSRDSSPTFRGSHINGNTSRFAGGGIYHGGQFGPGSVVSTLVLEDSDVSANVSIPFSAASNPAEGGGIHIEDNAVAKLTRVHVVGNRANSGGGINAYRARYEVVDSTIDGNQAQARTDGGVPGGSGGGIGASSHAPDGNGPPSVVLLTGSLVRNNVGVTGGGFNVSGDTNVRATLTLSVSVVDNNESQEQGGGILVSNAALTTTDSLIIRNTVLGGSNPNGGGLDITTNSTANITGTTFAHNVAGVFGGGIFMFGGANTLTMSGSNLYENTAGSRGGALFVGNGAGAQSGTISNSIIADNHGGTGQINEEGCVPGMHYSSNTIMGTAFAPACNPGSRATGTDSVGPPRFNHFLATPRAGTSTTLAWSVARAASITVAGVAQSSANVPTGTMDVAPTASTSYSLTATATAPNGGNYSTQTAVFTVQGPPPPPPPPPTGKSVDGDFDGDGRSDITVFRPSTGTWHFDYSGPAGTGSVAWGNSADVIVPGDYDGDGRADPAVFRPSTGTFYILNSRTGTVTSLQWGNGADVPVPADYDGDGKTDVAIFRPSTGTWFIVYSRTGTVGNIQFGNGADRPLPGDYDGDGRADIAVFRPSTGTWFILNSSTGAMASVQWGNGNDVAVPGDYDGDRRTDPAVFRPSNGTWFILNSSTGGVTSVQWGNGADRPVPGDYNGDGKTDIAVFRPSVGTWYVHPGGGGATVQWGNGNDTPILKRP